MKAFFHGVVFLRLSSRQRSVMAVKHSRSKKEKKERKQRGLLPARCHDAENVPQSPVGFYGSGMRLKGNKPDRHAEGGSDEKLSALRSRPKTHRYLTYLL